MNSKQFKAEGFDSSDCPEHGSLIRQSGCEDSRAVRCFDSEPGKCVEQPRAEDAADAELVNRGLVGMVHVRRVPSCALIAHRSDRGSGEPAQQSTNVSQGEHSVADDYPDNPFLSGCAELAAA